MHWSWRLALTRNLRRCCVGEVMRRRPSQKTRRRVLLLVFGTGFRSVLRESYRRKRFWFVAVPHGGAFPSTRYPNPGSGGVRDVESGDATLAPVSPFCPAFGALPVYSLSTLNVRVAPGGCLSALVLCFRVLRLLEDAFFLCSQMGPNVRTDFSWLSAVAARPYYFKSRFLRCISNWKCDCHFSASLVIWPRVIWTL